MSYLFFADFLAAFFLPPFFAAFFLVAILVVLLLKFQSDDHKMLCCFVSCGLENTAHNILLYKLNSHACQQFNSKNFTLAPTSDHRCATMRSSRSNTVARSFTI